MDRREALADAGIRLTARGGIRALTHRAVDAEAGLAAGSTSYYARTRRELTALVVTRVTGQLAADLGVLEVPEHLDDAAVVGIAVSFLEQLAARRDAQAARLALLLELRDDEELRAPLTASDPVRDGLLRAAHTLLDALRVAAPEQAAVDLVGLVDAMLLYRVAAVGPLDPVAVLTAHVAGLPRR
ncbi:TetR/AcrR family transcriptional regulator [Curtobacterium sp. 9128]|uniref:TetR/AcrR family transcriptional regulator n=1 Tax=Curtobacterium sp. 9128 TaxID=1793722 RepID=UPI0011A74A9E|nr:TetR family transcriptional regulator [Curtobacterium sp. 9128]